VPEAKGDHDTAPAEPKAVPGAAPGFLGRARLLIALGGLLAGLVAFGVGEWLFDLIPPTTVQQNISGNLVMLPNRETWIVADTRNGAINFALLGACLGGFLGVAGGLAQKSSSGAGTAGLVGAIFGAAVGAGLSIALLSWFLNARYAYSEYDIVISLFMHGLIWGLLGAVAGVAFALGSGNSGLGGRAALAGCVGALIGTLVYEICGAVAFTEAHTDYVISQTWVTRLLARLLVAAGTAAALVLILRAPAVRGAARPLKAHDSAGKTQP
jgi:hypothetical protein